MQSNGKFTIMTLFEFHHWLIARQVKRTISHIQNHHTWSPSYRNFNGNNYYDKLAGMEESHIQRGFNGIAQNFTTFPDGIIGVCRDIEQMPAGIKYANKGGICIEHLGNFDEGGDPMTEVHRRTIIQVNALLCYKFELTPTLEHIVYHHWFKLSTGERDGGNGDPQNKDHKTCPGTAFFGGNTEEDCSKNFLPLIVDELKLIGQNINAQLDMKGVVHASILNVRSGPAVSYPVVRKLKENDMVTVVASDGKWDQLSGGGWVNADYIVLR
jgi:hypothetical protein